MYSLRIAHLACLRSIQRNKNISLIESIVNFLFAERATRKSSTRISGSTQRAEDEFKWSNKYAGISGKKRRRQHFLSPSALHSVWVSDCWPIIPIASSYSFILDVNSEVKKKPWNRICSNQLASEWALFKNFASLYSKDRSTRCQNVASLKFCNLAIVNWIERGDQIQSTW